MSLKIVAFGIVTWIHHLYVRVLASDFQHFSLIRRRYDHGGRKHLIGDRCDIKDEDIYDRVTLTSTGLKALDSIPNSITNPRLDQHTKDKFVTGYNVKRFLDQHVSDRYDHDNISTQLTAAMADDNKINQ